LTECRDIYAVGVSDRDWSDVALLFAGPALSESSEQASLELIIVRVHDIAIEDDEVNRPNRSLSETDSTAEARISETEVSLKSPLDSGAEVVSPRKRTASRAGH
jgi:hypothetical protein